MWLLRKSPRYRLRQSFWSQIRNLVKLWVVPMGRGVGRLRVVARWVCWLGRTRVYCAVAAARGKRLSIRAAVPHKLPQRKTVPRRKRWADRVYSLCICMRYKVITTALGSVEVGSILQHSKSVLYRICWLCCTLHVLQGPQQQEHNECGQLIVNALAIMATQRQLVNVKCILINPHIFHLKHFNANCNTYPIHTAPPAAPLATLNVIIWHKLRV